MGARITIDSASLMNKGLEVIEAKWLINLQRSQIGNDPRPTKYCPKLVQFNEAGPSKHKLASSS